MELFISQLAPLLVVNLLGCMSPGPDFLVVSSQSLKFGWKTGLISALGIASGLLVHIAIAIVGVGVILAKYPAVFLVVKVIGAGYLLILGAKMLREPSRKQGNKKSDSNPPEKSVMKSFMHAFFVNVTNIKALLFFIFMYSTILSANTPLWAHVIYGGVIVTEAALWFSFVAFFLSRPAVREQYEKGKAIFESIFGSLLILLGLKVAYESLKEVFVFNNLRLE